MSEIRQSSILDRVFAAKRAELSARRAAGELATIEAQARQSPAPLDFVDALRKRTPAIIAEIKRASPSKGDIMPGLSPAGVAREYRDAGAAALSVLTDHHFKGSLDDLRSARAAIELPILRKDFFFDPDQLYEARAAGADCILLIAAMLAPPRLQELTALAGELGMAALLEVHDQAEFDFACRIGAQLIGINNRNLHTFHTDITTTAELLRGYRGDALIVSESGIESAAQMRQLYQAGACAFLIGESLLRCGTPGKTLSSLVEGFREQPPR